MHLRTLFLYIPWIERKVYYCYEVLYTNQLNQLLQGSVYLINSITSNISIGCHFVMISLSYVPRSAANRLYIYIFPLIQMRTRGINTFLRPIRRICLMISTSNCGIYPLPKAFRSLITSNG